MVSNIIADVHLFYFTVLAELGIEVFVKGVKVLLDSLSVECVSRAVDWVLVDVSTENGLTELRTHMFSTVSPIGSWMTPHSTASMFYPA